MGNGTSSQGQARRPVINNRQVTLSDSEFYDSTNVEYERVEDISSRNLAAAAQGEYKPIKQQTIALNLVLVCEFFRNMSMHSLIYWIPLTLQLNMGFFTENGEVMTDKFDELSLRISVIPSISFIFTYGCGWIVGIFTDACVRKTRILFISGVLMYMGFIYMTVLLYDISNNLSCMAVNGSYGDENRFVNCTFEAALVAGFADNYHLWMIYVAVVYILSVLESIFETVLPVLAGDQMENRNEVRQFYARYYWVRKLGEVFSCLVCITFLLVLPEDPFESDKYSGFYNFLAEGWATFLIIASTAGMIALFVVVCGRITREPRPDVSVIVDTVGIWKQAFSRREHRLDGTSFLTPAMWRYGGEYPEGAVKERGNMMQFFVVVLCLIPVAFTTQIPVTFVPNYLYDETHQRLNLTSSAFLDTQQENLEIVLYNMLGNRGASALFIPLYYYSSRYLYTKWRVQISFLQRLTAGQIAMILSILIFILTSHLYDFEVTLRSLLAPSIFLGICNALVYTAGYELTFLAAPRAMQATSMGLFYCLDGIANIINIVAVYTDYSEKLTYYMVAGMLSTISGLVVLIILHKKFGLRLHS